MEILHQALKYLSEHQFKENELRDKLLEDFGASPEKEKRIEEVLLQLRAEEIISDFRTGKSVIERYSHKGNVFLVDLLKKKNISPDIIQCLIHHLEDENLRAFQESYLRIQQSKETVGFTKVKIARFLRGRGFTPAVIVNTVEKLAIEGLLHE